MPLFFAQTINAVTKLGIWKITEPEAFFLNKVPLQQTITHPHKRLQHLAGRYLLQYLFPDFPYQSILIADTRKPFLPEEEYHFSISHCGHYAAAIVSATNRVGIDIEIPTPKINRISHKFLHASEQAFLASANSDSNVPMEKLTIIWSAKEAVFKWWGLGNVDFSEHIVLQPFALENAGTLLTHFYRTPEVYLLNLQYRQFQEIYAVWVAS